jgi:PAS domain S-box-containing protein
MKKRIYLFLILLLLTEGVCAFSSLALETAQGRPRHVLVLNSYEKGIPWTDNIMQGVESALKEKEHNLVLYIEYMGVKRVRDRSHFFRLFNLYRSKFTGTKFDLVVASGNDALNFILKYRDALFSGIPVVFCGIHNITDILPEGTPLFTGVVEETDVKGTVRAALRLHPGASEIIAVFNTTPTGAGRKELFLAALQSGSRPLKQTVFDDPVLPDFEKAIEQKGKNSIVLLFGSFKNREGSIIPPEESTRILARHDIPLYCLYDFDVGAGAVGGMVVSGFQQGLTAGNMALRILGGERAETIPVVRESPNRYMFDYNQLVRFDINRESLPEGSIILSKPAAPPAETPPPKVRIYVAGGVAAAIFLLVLIITAGRRARRREGRAESCRSQAEGKEEKAESEGATEQEQTHPAVTPPQSGETPEVNGRGYRTLFELAPNPVFVLDERGTFIDGNRAALDFLECDMEEIKGKTPGDFLANNPEQKPRGSGQPSTEFTTFESDYVVHGSTRTLLLNSIPAVVSGKKVFYVVGQDVTERRRTEKALRESEENLRKTMNLSPVAISITNGHGVTEYVNDKFVRTFGYTVEDISTMDRWWESAYPNRKYRDQAYTAWQEATQKAGETGEESAPQEWKVTCKDGSTRDIEFRFVTIGGKNLTIYNDVSDRKQMEAELLKSKNLESMGTLAGGMAHDFNNLLQVILGNIALARTGLSRSDRSFERLADAEKASMMAKDLIQQLITFSQGGEPVKDVMVVTPILMDVTHIALSGSNVKCRYIMPDDLRPVEVDEAQFKQVIHNIVTNAREAMPQGGTITVYAENFTVTRVDGLPLKEGDYVRISVQDRGVGIKDEHLSKIFDPYFTTKEMGSQKGMGLGLSISYSIIKKHRGHISVESAIGRGTTLHIYLPAHDQALHLVDKPGRQEKEARKRKGSVLVMDDAIGVRDVTGAMLDHLGFEVAYARDGLEAVDLYRNARDSGYPFDAVILNFAVQGAMGGREAMPLLLAIDPHVRAVISTGYAKDPIMSEYRKFGFKSAIVKPYKMEELKTTLESLLNHAPYLCNIS